MSTELETVDLTGVDILAVGGPYFGHGSPADGDYYDEADLRRIVDNTNRLMAVGELRPPNKLGHSIDQTLVKETGLTDGEMPAVGWLDNVRYEDGKIVTDIRKVPKKLASLIEAGAFRTRSAELKSFASQKLGGEKVGPAIKGLAWLGAKSPAVRTLDDVFALYSDEPGEDERTVEYGDPVWVPTLGYRWVQDAVSDAVGTGYYVADIGPESALLFADDDSESWVVPFQATEDGLMVAPQDEWTRADSRWISVAREYLEANERGSAVPADTKGEMQVTFTEEQVETLAAKLGLEDPTTLDSDAIMVQFEEGEGEGEDGKILVPADEFATVKAQAERGAAAEKMLAEMERDTFLKAAAAEGKINPGEIEDWTRRYDEAPEFTKEIVSALKPHDEFVREFGSDESGSDGSEKALMDAFDNYMGVEAVA